ncbi:SIMPL domain-containing protein [Algoriphagus sp.]|uniref:SIMPL domain-containing protein n=1 Tax=Algoriphagus sp. TaxID=1872435 RepID=UPI0025F82D82|nr:SIMPL domain-containing protein [Algoriphagus sp.]
MKNLIALLFGIMLALPIMAQDDLTIPLIEVEGFAERKIAPDEAVFSISLEEKSMKVTDATEVLNTKTKNLAKALEKAKIKDYMLVADNFSVNINRIYRSGYARDSGYVASQNLQIRTSSKNEDLQKIVEAIQDSGDMSFNLNFQISEATEKSLENGLLTEALKNAESQARLIAETLGIKTIRVHRVSLNASQPVYKMEMMNARADAVSPALISPDNQSLQKRVIVKYTY